MSVYQRFFRTTEGPLVDEIARLNELRSAAAQLYKDLGDKYGAKQVNNYDHNGQFAGFIFEEKPDTEVYRLIKKHRMWCRVAVGLALRSGRRLNRCQRLSRSIMH